jgi:hypothetical protein
MNRFLFNGGNFNNFCSSMRSRADAFVLDWKSSSSRADSCGQGDVLLKVQRIWGNTVNLRKFEERIPKMN